MAFTATKSLDFELEMAAIIGRSNALGEPVTAVALDMGYASTSAFVKLFRESLGVTPGRYFAG